MSTENVTQLDRADISSQVALARRLIALANEQQRQALTNMTLAHAGLGELEAELATRGIAGAEADLDVLRKAAAKKRGGK